ncbi:response regulator, partial [Bacteriovoracales bacterium]|nr:response regulator [Bacteriovoracales bacterium]
MNKLTSKKKILIVDDNAKNIKLIGDYLKLKTNYETIIAQNGEEAISRALKFIPNLILMDINMPVMDGVKACKKIKESETCKDIPIIFLTAETSISDKLKALGSGGSDFLTKPFFEEELILRINLHLEIQDSKESIKRNLSDTKSILDNMKQGVFAIAKDGIITPPVSEYCAEIFGESIIGKSIFETLFKDLDKDVEGFSQIKLAIGASIGSDHIQYLCVEESLPSKIIMTNHKDQKCHLRLSFSPIVIENKIVEKILFVVEDVTALDELERKTKENEENSLMRLKMLQEIVANSKSEFKTFIDESNNNLELCKISMESEDLKSFFRGIHTIKGLSNLYGLSNISKDVHLLENKVVDLKSLKDNKKMPEILLEIVDSLKLAISRYHDLYKEIFEFKQTKDSEDEEIIEIPKERFLFVKE